MSTKCWDIETGTEAFVNALWEASETPSFNKKLEIIFSKILELRDNVDPELLPELILELKELVQGFPEIEAATAGFERAFNKDFNFLALMDRLTKLDEEETDLEKLNRKAQVKKDFIMSKFKDELAHASAGRAMLYFQRDAHLKLLETFIVDRTHGYLVSDLEIKGNVKRLKQSLVDTVVDYLRSVGFTDALLGSTVLYDEEGNFHDILGPGSLLRAGIDKYLELGKGINTNFIKNSYENFRGQKGDWEKSKKFIEAYNAKILLDDFDALTTMLLGSIVKPESRNGEYNNLNNENYTTKFNRATNMFGNGFGDDVENIADLISDITLKLIQTSKRYTWKSSEPMHDLYLNFLDFNYIVTKVKDLARNSESRKIKLDNDFFLNNDRDNLSKETLRTIDTLTQLKQSQGYEDSSPTLADVLAFVSDNPQRHLHAIFDLLCNTDIVEHKLGFSTNDKNLIWTVGKELFGTWPTTTDAEGNPVYSRSLYDLHLKSNNDRIFEIVTQAADSMFKDEFLLYYEDAEGTLKLRILQDYAVSLIKNDLVYGMQQAHGMYDEQRFADYISKYNITLVPNKKTKVYSLGKNGKSAGAWKIENPQKGSGLTAKIDFETSFIAKIIIPLGNGATIEYSASEGGYKPLVVGKTLIGDAKEFWESDTVRNFINDTIGIDFNTDVELKAAYEELFKNSAGDVVYANVLNDILKICATAAYNQTFNNYVVPKVLREAGNRERNVNNVTILRKQQYSGQKFIPALSMETGVVELIPNQEREAFLDKLGTAVATVHGLLTSAQVKTGEGTALASLCLHCLRSSHAYQILTQNKNANSGTKHLTYVNNDNGFFLKVLGRREFKSAAITRVNTDMSSVEAFTASFLGGFVGAFCEASSGTINKDGRAFIIPAVYSDKTKQDELEISLNAKSTYNGKRYRDMTDLELEEELKAEFGQMYDTVVNNINEELAHFADVLRISPDTYTLKYGVLLYAKSLVAITDSLCSLNTALNIAQNKGKTLGKFIETNRKVGVSDEEIFELIKKDKNLRESLGKVRKSEIIKQMNNMMSAYNKTHRRKPIEMCENIHYLFDKDGMLVPNDTLIALWGRFKGDSKLNERLGITNLYPEGHKAASTVEGYFKYEKDVIMAQELLADGFELYLSGNPAKKSQPEIEYLKKNYPDWITPSGKMAIAKIFTPYTNTKYNVEDQFIGSSSTITIKSAYKNKNGEEMYDLLITKKGEAPEFKTVSLAYLNKVQETPGNTYNPIPYSQRKGYWKIVYNADELEKAAANPETKELIQIHPMLTKINRIYYLAALQYTSSVGGAHYVYKGKGANVLEEEASRWLASNKRNVCYASTVHKYQNKTLNGVPKWYQLGTVEDIKSIIYSIMGDLDSHKPIDGGMFVNPWFPILENNSLGGEAAGLDKKQFGTYYYEKYAAGGIIKTAGFAITNLRMRRSIPYQNLCKNMTNRTWIKEFAAIDGSDIEEHLDITRDYKGNVLNWIQDDNGKGTFYERDTNGGRGRGLFKLAKIEAIYTNGSEERIFEGDIPAGWTPTNRYKIYEYPVTRYGEIDNTHPAILEQINNPELSEISPIQRLEGADENGEFTINSNWELFTKVFGGFDSQSMDNRGILVPSENSVYQMVHALNNIGYVRTVDNNSEQFGEERYTVEDIEEVKDLDDLWLPLKYSDVSYAPNIGALKSTQMNVNPAEAMYEDLDAKGEYMNAMQIQLANLGIQLDKEHHADDSEVSMPTQIISACANKGYTIQYADKLYQSLSTLTELCIADCMDGIMELMPGNENKGTLLKEITQIIVDNLIRTKDDNSALNAAMKFLVEKVQSGEKVSAEDARKIAWSDSDVYSKIYSTLASHFTNNAIKMKAAGSLAVICPTEKMEQMYGDQRLDSYSSVEKNLSVLEGLRVALEKIRTEPNEGLIFDSELNKTATILDRANLASNIKTQHHYWIEWTTADGEPLLDENNNIYRESITIDLPSQYYKLKDWLCAGGKSGEIKIGDLVIPRRGMTVAKVYENITQGRELSAFNVRFESLEPSDSGKRLKFCIFDIDSIRTLFSYNDLDETFENALSVLNDKLIAEQKEQAYNYIAKLIKKQSPKVSELVEEFLKMNPSNTLEMAFNYLKDNEDVSEAFTKAAFKVGRVLTYKVMEKDLFKISKDYNGERQLWVDDLLVTINPETIQALAYELIMPKVYQSKFGLRDLDLIWEILKDPDFFSKRAVEKISQLHISDSCFHYELKSFSGNHVYIWDSRLGEPNPDIFLDKTTHKIETSPGVWERVDIEGNTLHGLASNEDRIMQIGNLGLEVIVTDNPEYYFQNMQYSLGTFSNNLVNEEVLQLLADNLKNTSNKAAKKFVRSITFRDGKLKKFSNLKKRNDTINNLSLEAKKGDTPEIAELRLLFLKEGREMHTSFNKSLDIIAGRIPAQSLQSFMPQRVVAFDDNDINTAYVSTFLLFLQGSDLDIDAVNLIGSEFDDNGNYVLWSNLADISTIENLEASLELPFPTGLETDIEINDKKDNFFDIYEEYLDELFELERDDSVLEDGTGFTGYAVNDKGFPILKLKSVYTSPDHPRYNTLKREAANRIKILAHFIEDVNKLGINIKGDTKSDGSWKSSKAAEESWKQSNILKVWGFDSLEAAYNAAEQIKALIDSHNNYVNEVSRTTREKMTKNMCQYAMMAVCSTPSNLVELMVGVDVATDPIKNSKTGAVVLSPYNGADKRTAPGSYYTVHRSFLEGLIGKQCVGIGAVSIKVNSASQYYIDTVLRNGTDREKERILFPTTNSLGNRSEKGTRGYSINGKRYLGLANLYDKSSETADLIEVEINGEKKMMTTSQKNLEIIELLDSLQTPEDITPNVAMSLAAMLSVAVDNAKDLALAKINAGPKMFGFYAYGISLGMDIRELANIINTPLGRAISKLCEGNALNGQMGAFSALKAIEKLEGKKLYNDLIYYDLFGKVTVEDETTRETYEVRPTIDLTLKVPKYGVTPKLDYSEEELENKSVSLSTASQVLTHLMQDYYNRNILADSNVMNKLKGFAGREITGKTADESLTTMVYRISLAGKMGDCLRVITNKTITPTFELVLELSSEFDNAEDWQASLYQLVEYCRKYGDLVKTYYKTIFAKDSPDGKIHKPYLDLKILAQGAEEMRILGTLLGSNKGVRSKIEEGTTFIKTIENAVIDRKKIMGKTSTDEDKIDFLLFCTDELYREEAIEKYEDVKHSINILDVISKVPHMFSYIRTTAIPYAGFTVGSAKFRARNNYYDVMVNKLNAQTSSQKTAVLRGIENAVNHRLFKEWLALELMQFFLPKGSTKFIGRNQEFITTTEDLYIPLFDKDGNGLATFKYYMENKVIPELQRKIDYSTNSFVLSLRPFEMTKTGTHAAVTAYSSRINMIPKDESLEVELLTCIADFAAMYDYTFEGGPDASIHNVPASYADAFYLYSQYVFGGRRGPNSLMGLFNAEESTTVLHFKEYIAAVDAESDIPFQISDLVKWCAFDDNVYHPSSEFFYATPQGKFGKQLMKKPSKEQDSEEASGEEERVVNKGPIQVDTPLSPENRNNYLYPSVDDMAMIDSRYKTGKNVLIEEIEDLLEVVLDAENPEGTFSISPNYDSGEYHLVSNGYLSPKAQEIFNRLSSILPNALRRVYNVETKGTTLSIDSNFVKASLEEIINEIDGNC